MKGTTDDIECIDLMPMGSAETVVAWPDRRVLGLYVRASDASTLGMLAIRCAIGVHGQDLPLGLAISDGPIDVSVPLHSNPRRHVDEESDGA